MFAIPQCHIAALTASSLVASKMNLVGRSPPDRLCAYLANQSLCLCSERIYVGIVVKRVVRCLDKRQVSHQKSVGYK